MTLDEKLQHFYTVSVDEAHAEAYKDIEAHKKSLDKMLKEHKEASMENAEKEVKAETVNAKREIKKALSSRQLTIKRDLTRKQNALKDKLFADVKKRLEQFSATPEYEDYLFKKIEEARAFAGKDKIFIYLSPEDSSLLQSLTQRTGLPLELSQDSFQGGIRAMIPDKNILIDHSFLGNYETVYKEFKFDGGLK